MHYWNVVRSAVSYSASSIVWSNTLENYTIIRHMSLQTCILSYDWPVHFLASRGWWRWILFDIVVSKRWIDSFIVVFMTANTVCCHVLDVISVTRLTPSTTLVLFHLWVCVMCWLSQLYYLGFIYAVTPRAGSKVVRMDPLHFLARCHTRRLNQA